MYWDLVSGYLQPGFGVLSQFLLIHRYVVLGQPVTVKDGSLQCRLPVNVREVFQGDTVNVLIGPVPLLILHQSENGDGRMNTQARTVEGYRSEYLLRQQWSHPQWTTVVQLLENSGPNLSRHSAKGTTSIRQLLSILVTYPVSRKATSQI